MKYLTLVLSFFLATPAIAQFTIEGRHLPKPGDTLIFNEFSPDEYEYNSNPFKEDLKSHLGFDYFQPTSIARQNENRDTLIFTNPQTLPKSQNFPNSHMGLYLDEDDVYIFFTENNNGLYIDGFYSKNDELKGVFDMKPDVLYFPIGLKEGDTIRSQGRAFIDTTLNGLNGRAARTLITTFIAEKENDLIHPYGLYKNSLRIKVIEEEYDTAYTRVLGNFVPVRTESDREVRFDYISNNEPGLQSQVRVNENEEITRIRNKMIPGFGKNKKKEFTVEAQFDNTLTYCFGDTLSFKFKNLNKSLFQDSLSLFDFSGDRLIKKLRKVKLSKNGVFKFELNEETQKLWYQGFAILKEDSIYHSQFGYWSADYIRLSYDTLHKCESEVKNIYLCCADSFKVMPDIGEISNTRVYNIDRTKPGIQNINITGYTSSCGAVKGEFSLVTHEEPEYQTNIVLDYEDTSICNSEDSIYISLTNTKNTSHAEWRYFSTDTSFQTIQRKKTFPLPDYNDFAIISLYIKNWYCDISPRKTLLKKPPIEEQPLIEGREWAELDKAQKYTASESDENYIWQWKAEGGEILADSSAQSVEVKWNNTGNKRLEVAFFDTIQNCPGEPAFINVSVTQGISELHNAGLIQIWPNPAINSVNLTIDPNQDIRYHSLVNTVGERIEVPYATKDGGYNLDCSKLKPGTYFIRIQSSSEIIKAYRLIKQ